LGNIFRALLRSPITWLLFGALILVFGLLVWMAAPQPAAVSQRYARTLAEEEAVLREMLSRTPNSEALRLRLASNLRFQYLYALGERYRRERSNDAESSPQDDSFRREFAAGAGSQRLAEILESCRQLAGSRDTTIRRSAASIETWALRELGRQVETDPARPMEAMPFALPSAAGVAAAVTAPPSTD
jgi:hypothetical protein